MMMGPAERSMDFKGSGKRLLSQIAQDRVKLWGMVAAVVGSVGCSVVGPKILGEATDLVFAGIIGRQMPAGITKEQALDGLRAKGEGGMADMLSGTDFTPGEGIDFGAVGVVAIWALVVFTLAGLLMLVATRLSNHIMNGTVYRLREELQGSFHGCRCRTSTGRSAARCSAGPPTTSTTSGRRSSRRWVSCSTRC